MNTSIYQTLSTVELLDERDALSLEELCRASAAPTPFIVELVEEGVLQAHADSGGNWHFGGTQLARVRVAHRLHRDLEVNLAGIALALQLLDELAQWQSIGRPTPVR